MKKFTGLILLVMALMSCGQNDNSKTTATQAAAPPLQMQNYTPPGNAKNPKIFPVVFLYFDTASKDSTFKWAQGFIVQGEVEQLVKSKNDSTKFERKPQTVIVDVLDKYKRKVPATWFVWDNRVVQGQ